MTDSLDRLREALKDRYTIERELGQGGMATVYLAQDLKHERQVAIKVLREDLSASLGSGRFLREIKIAAQLQHPHILPLLDSGEADGFLYFVMPYIKGQSLRERIAREGELPVHEAVRLITEVVDALITAHEHGVVHRDIKPDNVMLSGRHALVTDFGVAKAISEATGRNTVTTLGVAVGTPTYMSPEQAAADPHVDHRSDIYSVGVMAYEMLAGRPPFSGGTPQQVLAAHVTEAPDPVAKRRQAIPPALEAIVMRCLAKRPADRFQTAAELHAALEPLATPSTGITPIQTRPIEGYQSRSRTPLIVVGVGVLLAAGILLATRGRGGSGSAGVLVTPITVQATSSGMAEMPSVSPDGTRIAYATRKCDTSGLCFYDLVIQDIGGAGTLTAASGATAIYSQNWSPDGRFLIVSGSWDKKWGIYLVPATVQGPPRFIGCCDGDFLASADTILMSPLVQTGDSVVWLKVVTAADLRVRDSIRVSHPGIFASPAVSPNGKRILLSLGQKNGPAKWRVIQRDGSVLDTATQLGTVRWWTPDGKAILTSASVPGATDVFDLLAVRLDGAGRFSGRVDTIWHRATMQGGVFQITADGGALVFSQGARENSIVSMQRSDQASTKFTSKVLLTSTAGLKGFLSPDGKQIGVARVLSAGGDHPRTQLSMIPFDSGPERAVTSPLDTLISWGWYKGQSTGIQFSTPQSKGVDRVEMFDASTGRTSQLFSVPDSTADLIVAVTANGNVISYRSTDRDLSVRSSTGVETKRIHVPGVYIIDILVPSPSGEEVAVLGYDISTEDTVVVYRVGLADGKATQVAGITAETYSNVTWLDSGDILVVIGETRQTYALYRLGKGGDVHRLGVLPFTDVRYTLARDGLRMLASRSVPHGDVWLVKNFGKMWRKQ